MAASTLTSWALLVWEELKARDRDAAQVFSDTGLDPSKLGSSVARYPIEKMQQLWWHVRELEGDGFGVDAGSRWSPTTFHALGFAWLASATLGEAFYRFSRYGQFVSDGLSYDLSADGLYYRFSVAHEWKVQPQLCPLSTDASIIAMLKMLRMLLGESFAPVELHCPHAPNSAAWLLEQKAGCPVYYGGEGISLLLERYDVEKKLNTGNAELSLVNEQIITRHLAELQKERLTTQVEVTIVNQLPSGNIKEENVADALHLSRRTMQRRLAEEGTSFSKILEEKRMQLAKSYIADDTLAISEVAYLLGFSEQANFARAFKRWYGSSPSEYRRDSVA
ncbi:AraC family transcriptional regulator [Pseudomaricurvus sp. HS19]|uniref:AraC family transcriptional regulator n=1 Tax=Pseudomaricurvus sp. HS19 TaxID=2692626 RepID=UPI0013713C3D|nr:AraC family transcriptional regulator [Pseudomaricurvus sp. HS19]MYM61954.1 helix-turn-helix domain-containing protein [Pseudomaricurvus sp. HS19]